MSHCKEAVFILIVALLLCGISRAQEVPKAAGINELPRLSFCKIPDSTKPESAFVVTEQGNQTDLSTYWLTYSCHEPCPDWKVCSADIVDRDGQPQKSRGANRKQLAFVTDKMGGFLHYSPAGDKTIVFHGGGGGTELPYHRLVDVLEAQTNVRTVQIVWAHDFYWGWYTRTSPEPRTVVQQNERPAAVLKWIHDHLADGYEFGTVGNSMGTIATLGPVLWHGLDPLIQYQVLIGGPPMWDVNASCGAPKYPNGYVTYVTGYYEDDGTTMCQIIDGDWTGKRICQVPAPIGWFTLWESLFDHLSASHRCSEGDGPSAQFDLSSMRFTVRDWTVHHDIDFLINLDGPVSPELKKYVPPVDKVIKDMDSSRSQAQAAGISTGGDEAFAIGHFMYIYNAIQPRADVSWTTKPGGHSHWTRDVDSLVPFIKRGMNLQ